LILLTSLLDVLSEKTFHIEDFGEGKLASFRTRSPPNQFDFIFPPDAPINVGWGSKETQFHGSLGKTAAQAPSTSKIGVSPDDDNLPRISWRGDSAFFVVSSLSPDSNHRTLRVYDRQGLLQTTSEDVAGLEHPLVWRPSGNLIIGTQRFGFEGGGAGKEGRHDVIFFERNGLRHGEFTLRVDQIGVKDKGVDHERRWGYKVRELAWNSDSNVFAIWIESDVGDIGKILLKKVYTCT
jgi:elongator complex protein 1